MVEWSRPSQRFFHILCLTSIEDDNGSHTMTSKLTFVLVFASGLAVALLASFLPSLIGFLGDGKRVKRIGLGHDHGQSHQMVAFSYNVPALAKTYELAAKKGNVTIMWHLLNQH